MNEEEASARRLSRRHMGLKAHAVFVPLEVIRNAPPIGFTSWKQPGAMLAFLRSRKLDVEEFVNWRKERLDDADRTHIGYVLYFRGEEPTEAHRQRFLIIQ